MKYSAWRSIMPSIDDYEHDPAQVLIDAAADPIFRSEMDPEDIEIITVTWADGTQGQVQALSRGAVRRVIERVIKRCQKKGADLKHWTCSKDEFDLCGKLANTPPGKIMRLLHDFLEKKWVQGGFVLVDFFTLSSAPPVGVFLAIFGGLCFVDGCIVDLCECP
jgi:hypothetical protein